MRNNHYFYAARFVIDGEVQEREFFAHTIQRVRQELIHQGATILSIRPRNVKFWQRAPVSWRFKFSFLEDIHNGIQVGQAATSALDSAIRNVDDPRLRTELRRAEVVINRGGNFADAIDALDFYDQTVIETIAAGDKAGGAGDAIAAAIEYMEMQTKGRLKWLSTFAILTVEYVTGVSGLLMNRFHLLPELESTMQQSKADMTQEAFDRLSNAYLLNDAFLVFALAVLSIFVIAVVRSGRSRTGGGRFDMILSRIPIIRRAAWHKDFAVSFSMMSRLLAKGVALMDALTLASRVSGTEQVRQYWQSVIARIRKGQQPSVALKSDMLHRAERTVFAGHKTTEHLAQAMERSSKARTAEADAAFTGITRLGMAFAIAFGIASILVVFYALQTQDSVAEQLMNMM